MSAKNTINQLLARFGFFSGTPTQDASTAPVSRTATSLQAHDKQYHPNGWKPGDKCRLRDSIFNVDDLQTPTGKTSQTGTQSQSQSSSSGNSDFPTEKEFDNLVERVKRNPRLVPPNLKKTLDDMPGKIFALAENQEYLDAAIADIPDGAAKNSLLDDQKKLDDERDALREEFLKTYRVLASILGTDSPEPLKRNPPIAHDASHFPTSLDTTPTVNADGSVDVSFDGTSYHFVPCANGSTGPVEGEININGQSKKFILKLSNKPGIKHSVPPEALKNEQAAGDMFRKAGVNAPDSVLFEKNGEVYKLSEFIDGSTPLSQTTITPDIQRQLKEAYPLLDLMYSTDLMKDDNVRVDPNGKVWFVDNGSAFAFKGYGDKKSASNPKWKGFDFEQRNDAAGPDLPGNDGQGGTKNYPSRYGALYDSQQKIQSALGPMTQKEMLKEASRYNMSALVAGLPKESQCQALIDFAASLDRLSAKAAGTKKIKSSLKQGGATTAQQTQQNQQNQTQTQPAAASNQTQSQSQSAIPASVGSWTSIPAPIASILSQNGLQGVLHPEVGSLEIKNGASNTQVLQSIASQLPSRLMLTTHPNGSAYIVNASDYGSYWQGYHHAPFSQTGSSAAQQTQQSSGSSQQQSSPAQTTSTAPSTSGSNGSVQMMNLPGRTAQIPTIAYNAIVGLGGDPNASTLNSGLVYNYDVLSKSTRSIVAQTAQDLANKLGNSGFTVFTYPSGTGGGGIGIAHTGNPKDIPAAWGATTYTPQTTGAAQTPASAPASSQASQNVQSTTKTGSSSSSAGSSTPSATKTFSYGSNGSLVKSGGFTDSNVASDISGLVSGNNWVSKGGKILLAPGTRLKTQGSLANNGDLYVGFPRGVQQSDIASLANQLNGEYQQYGYNVYPMGNWLSIESAQQTNGASTNKNTMATSTNPPSSKATVAQPANQAVQQATSGNQSSSSATASATPSQPAAATQATAPGKTQQQSATTQPSQPSQPQTKTRKTLSQMIQQRLAKATPQQQSRFQAALNRANGNSGGIQQNTPSPAPAAQPAQQPSAQQTSAPAQTQTAGTNTTAPAGVVLTTPKSGNAPTPAQQKTIARFHSQIQNAKTPAQKLAFQNALSRYYSSI